LTFRQDNNRISRKTIGFPKKIKGLYNQMRFYSTHFNFFRDYRGLKTKRKFWKRKHLQKSLGLPVKNGNL